MKTNNRTLLFASAGLLVSLLISGCTFTDDVGYRRCVAATTVVGTGAGVAASAGGSVLAGAAIGSVAGLTLCQADEEAQSLEPPVVAAAAAPAPRVVEVADSDGDGVDDARDRCPNTPRGTEVDARGCPKPLVFDDRMLNFAFDSAELPANADTVLEAAVDLLRENPRARFTVVGHTDSIGTDAYNDDLSLRRATAVRDALVAAGISPDRLDVRGEGERLPVASNSTDDGRARNRRVEISLND